MDAIQGVIDYHRGFHVDLAPQRRLTRAAGLVSPQGSKDSASLSLVERCARLMISTAFATKGRFSHH